MSTDPRSELDQIRQRAENATELGRPIEHGDRVRILRPLTTAYLTGRVRAISHGSERPYVVELRDLTCVFLSANEVEWTR